MRKLILIITGLLAINICAQSANCATAWSNDLRTLFQNKQAIIYAVNIRTFNAKDLNNDGIIDESIGEERGSFVNAVNRLNQLKEYGVNTILLLPITPTGKTKALGTAGSLFATTEFNKLNPQLKSKISKASLEDEFTYFIDECHKRQIRVIVDLPCCGAYDLYLQHPELFKQDKNGKPIVPADWTDVRLLDAGTENQINTDVYSLYKEFINMMIRFDVDGIRADVAGLKPYTFWKKLIDETRVRNPQFLFIAEASSLSKNPCPESEFTSYDKLLEAGFDGYYGKYSEIKNWTSYKDLISAAKEDFSISKKYSESKAVIGNFATHDQISPILINGPQLSKMIIWLSTTLPMNSYYIDGFATGDNYLYNRANKKATQTFTDDEYYFSHRGQLDIFNFSRKPEGNNFEILNEFVIANHLKAGVKNILSFGSFVPLKTSIESVFAYARSFDKKTIIVIGNLDFKKSQKASIIIPKLSKELNAMPIKIFSIPVVEKNKINVELEAGEVQILYIDLLDLN